MNQLFNWHRFGLLIRNDLIRDSRDYLVVCAVFFIIMILNAVPSAGFGGYNEGFYYGLFGGLILIGGSISNSLQFTELYSKRKNDVWLLLPASALEKTISRYIGGTVLFVLIMIVFVTFSSLLIEGFNLLAFGRTNELFNPFSLPVLNIICAFTFIQPIFFLGGVWFKNVRWFKTVLFVWALSTCVGLFAALLTLLLFGGNFSEISSAFNNIDVDLEFSFRAYEWMETVFSILWFVGSPVFVCWVAWLRVRETQVSHGI